VLAGLKIMRVDVFAGSVLAEIMRVDVFCRQCAGWPEDNASGCVCRQCAGWPGANGYLQCVWAGPAAAVGAAGGAGRPVPDGCNQSHPGRRQITPLPNTHGHQIHPAKCQL